MGPSRELPDSVTRLPFYQLALRRIHLGVSTPLARSTCVATTDGMTIREVWPTHTWAQIFHLRVAFQRFPTGHVKIFEAGVAGSNYLGQHVIGCHLIRIQAAEVRFHLPFHLPALPRRAASMILNSSSRRAAKDNTSPSRLNGASVVTHELTSIVCDMVA